MDIMDSTFQIWGAIIFLSSISAFIWCYVDCVKEEKERTKPIDDVQWIPNYELPQIKEEVRCSFIYPSVQ
ncbi:hypothetical protein [Paenibacillus sp. 1A_MP2]|uniref:hypothetical protein n=1 Tax=Paenibacillus sp. 1A_MP2 TaxID=3457495 RepID=UPI003FCD9AB6